MRDIRTIFIICLLLTHANLYEYLKKLPTSNASLENLPVLKFYFSNIELYLFLLTHRGCNCANYMKEQLTVFFIQINIKLK